MASALQTVVCVLVLSLAADTQASDSDLVDYTDSGYDESYPPDNVIRENILRDLKEQLESSPYLPTVKRTLNDDSNLRLALKRLNPNQFFGARGRRGMPELPEVLSGLHDQAKRFDSSTFFGARGRRADDFEMASQDFKFKKLSPTEFFGARGRRNDKNYAQSPAAMRDRLLKIVQYFNYLHDRRASKGFEKRQPPAGFYPARGKRDISPLSPV